MRRVFNPLDRQIYFDPCPECMEKNRQSCTGHEPYEGVGMGAALKVKALPQLLADAGSLRILLNRYWRGRLESAEERVIENETKPEILIGYKPSDYR